MVRQEAAALLHFQWVSLKTLFVFLLSQPPYPTSWSSPSKNLISMILHVACLSREKEIPYIFFYSLVVLVVN